MGGVVNTGRNNDDLIDKLLSVDYIRSSSVERVFRAVDRADYFPPEARRNAYKDLAWKGDHLHLSAPCIYSEVMEGLCLSSGVSFLNLGSGTGYLSTMAGLILGSNGVNHGVEIHEDVVEYANKKLEEFKKNSGAMDEFDFCEPKFIQGNCLCLTPNRQYDRVYCGAACPEHYEYYMKSLLNVGGILVMPLNDYLMQVKRTSDVTWEDHSLLPVSFASLIQPIPGKQEIVEIFDVVPASLQSLSRTLIRSILRKNVELENPNLKKRAPVAKCVPNETALRRLVGPIFDDSGDDPFTSDDEPQFYIRNNRRTTENIFDVVIDQLGVRQRDGRLHQEEDDISTDNRSSDGEDPDLDVIDTEFPIIQNGRFEINEARNVIMGSPIPVVPEPHPPQERSEGVISIISTVEGVLDDLLKEVRVRRFDDAINEERVVSNEIERGFVDALHELEREVLHVQNEVAEEPQENTNNVEGANNVRERETTENAPSMSTEETSTSKKREKFDSGLGEDIVEKDQHQDSSENEHMDVDSSSSNDEIEGKRNKRGSKTNPESRNSAKWRRICLHTSDSCSSSSETVQEDVITSTSSTVTRQRRYAMRMRAKIQELPLPPTLKKYLNFYREF